MKWKKEESKQQSLPPTDNEHNVHLADNDNTNRDVDLDLESRSES